MHGIDSIAGFHIALFVPRRNIGLKLKSPEREEVALRVVPEPAEAMRAPETVHFEALLTFIVGVAHGIKIDAGISFYIIYVLNCLFAHYKKDHVERHRADTKPLRQCVELWNIGLVRAP